MANQFEHLIQCELFGWIRVSDNPHFKKAFAIPNGVHVSGHQGRKLNNEGRSAGVPDWMLPVASQGYHGLFVEMKCPGGYTSTKQDPRIKELRGDGYCVKIAYSAREAWDILNEYLGTNEQPNTL